MYGLIAGERNANFGMFAAGTLLTAIPTVRRVPVAAELHRLRAHRRSRQGMRSHAFLGEPHHDGSALYVSDQAPALGDDGRRSVPAGAAGRRRRPRRARARPYRDGEPRFTEASADARTGGSVGGYGGATSGGGRRSSRAQPGHPLPVPAARHARAAWLTAAGLRRRTTCPTPPTSGWSCHDAAAGVGCATRSSTRSSPTGSPGRRRGCRELPDWAIAVRLGHDPVIGRGPGTPGSSTAATSTASSSAWTTSQALGAEHRLPDADLPGPLQPPLRRRRPSTGSTRCSAATRRWPGWPTRCTRAACG